MSLDNLTEEEKSEYEKRQNILKAKSFYSLPNNPSSQGFSAEDIKKKAYEPALLNLEYIYQLNAKMNLKNTTIDSQIEAISGDLTNYYTKVEVDDKFELKLVEGTGTTAKLTDNGKTRVEILVDNKTIGINEDNKLEVTAEILNGANDYSNLKNKPSINGIEINGEMNCEDYNLQRKIDDNNKLSYNLLKDVPTVDTVVTEDSENLVESGAVYSAIQDVIPIAEGATRTWIAAITNTNNRYVFQYPANRKEGYWYSITKTDEEGIDHLLFKNSVSEEEVDWIEFWTLDEFTLLKAGSVFVDSNGNSIFDDGKVGQIVLLTEFQIPDFWISYVGDNNSYIDFRRLESSKVDLSSYQKKLTAGNGINISENVISVTGGVGTTVDSYLSSTSTNPVQNKVVNEAIDDIENRINGGKGTFVIELKNTENVYAFQDGDTYAYDGANFVSTGETPQTKTMEELFGEDQISLNLFTSVLYNYDSGLQINEFEVGDTILILEDDVPDRWISSYVVSGVTLPSDYQEVEYIETDGTNVIDAGWESEPTGKYEVKLKFKFNSLSTEHSNGICGSQSNYAFTVSSNGRFYLHNTSSASNISASVDTWYTIDDNWDSDSGQFVGSINSKTYSGIEKAYTAYEFYIFNFKDIKVGTLPLNGCLSYLEIYHNKELIHNYIACYRKADSVKGLYDTVTDTFLTADNLTAGADVPVVKKITLNKLETTQLSLDNYYNKNQVDNLLGSKQDTLTIDTALNTESDNPVSNSAIATAINNVAEVASGKCSTYVCSDVTNTILNSTEASISLTSNLTDIGSKTINISDLKIGDTIYITETDVPDRWVSQVSETSITLNKLETQKVDLSSYYTKTEVDTALGKKQDTLVSGTSIKTINDSSILGSGNLVIEGGSSTSDLGYYEEVSITYSLTNVSITNQVSGMWQDEILTLTVVADSGYSLPDDVTVENATYTWNNSTGILVLSNPTANVSFSITGTPSTVMPVKGQIITMNLDGTSRQYRVVKINGTQAEVVCMETVANVAFNDNISCFLPGTQITLSDYTTKSIEDITYDDELLVWDFDEGTYGTAKPCWLTKSGLHNDHYYQLTFDDGTVLKTTGLNSNHKVYNVDEHFFKGVDKTEIGDRIYAQSGIRTVTNKEYIEQDVEYYNIITSKKIDCFAEGILTSDRYGNLYTIDDNMKWIKDGREVRPYSEFEAVGISQYWYDNLRLGETTDTLEKVRDYIDKCESQMKPIEEE